jgi:NAD(P)-dependent dehydrogenase (short-subunit alcohol dehydrogenase family)
MIRLDGKTVLVTGGATGFGTATARIARELGAQVSIAGRRVDRGREAAAALGPDVLFVQADVSREDDVVRMLAAVQERYGRLDVLINNAGVIRRVPLAQEDVAGWDELMATNLRGVFLCCKHALPMLAETRGAIVNVSSVLAFAPRPGGRSTAYDASKAGVIALTRSVAVAHGPAGVRCNAVCPGFVMTEMTQDLWEKWSPQERDAFLQVYPLRRLGTADDMANAIIFLASDAASWITGQTLIVDGGQLATL